METTKQGALGRLVSWHEDLHAIDAVRMGVRRMLRNGKRAEAAQRLHATLSEDMAHHFLFEELVVFPAFDQVAALTAAVAGLIEEHRKLESATQALHARLCSAMATQEEDALVDQLFAAFLAHATREESLLVPAQEAHPGVRLAMSRLWLTHRIKFGGGTSTDSPVLRFVVAS